MGIYQVPTMCHAHTGFRSIPNTTFEVGIDVDEETKVERDEAMHLPARNCPAVQGYRGQGGAGTKSVKKQK